MLVDRILVLMLGLCLGAPAWADEIEDESPDIAFLEYLGMWEESDEEWLLHEDMQSESVVLRNEQPEGDRELPEDEETPEKRDES